MLRIFHSHTPHKWVHIYEVCEDDVRILRNTLECGSFVEWSEEQRKKWNYLMRRDISTKSFTPFPIGIPLDGSLTNDAVLILKLKIKYETDLYVTSTLKDNHSNVWVNLSRNHAKQIYIFHCDWLFYYFLSDFYIYTLTELLSHRRQMQFAIMLYWWICPSLNWIGDIVQRHRSGYYCQPHCKLSNYLHFGNRF